MKTPVEIFGSPFSQPTRMVLWTAKLLKVPFEFRLVDTGKAEQRSSTFKKLNPNANFPVMRTRSGFCLYESNAICRFLCTEREGDKDNIFHSESLYPYDAETRGEIDQWLDWKLTTLRPGAAAVVRRLVMKDKVKNKEHSMFQDFEEIQPSREIRLLNQALAILEDHLKTTANQYIVLSTSAPAMADLEDFTLADIAVFEELEQLMLLPSNSVYTMRHESLFPNVAAWQVRMRGVVGYIEVHQELLNLAAKFEADRKPSAS